MEMTVPVRDSFLMEVVPERVRATANAILTLSGQALAVLTIPLGARLLDAGRYPRPAPWRLRCMWSAPLSTGASSTPGRKRPSAQVGGSAR